MALRAEFHRTNFGEGGDVFFDHVLEQQVHGRRVIVHAQFQGAFWIERPFERLGEAGRIFRFEEFGPVALVGDQVGEITDQWQDRTA